MKKTPVSIRLFGGHVALVDAEDAPELEQYRWHIANGYAKRCLPRENGKSKFMPMHRHIMKPPQGMYVDHIDGDRLNNTRANLRVCTPKENAKNRRQNAALAGKYKGVKQRHNRFEASIQREGKKEHLGSFLTAEDAAHAYDCAARELHGEFAHLNGVRGNPSPMQLEQEARSVLAGTGLTPRQLVERVKELEEALRDAEEYISGHTPTNSWGLLDRREDADRRETLEKVRTAISKSLPNTVAEVK